MMSSKLSQSVLVGIPVERLFYMNEIVSQWSSLSCYAVETESYVQRFIPVKVPLRLLWIEHYFSMVLPMFKCLQ